MSKQPDASDFEVKVLQGSVEVTLSAHGRKIEVTGLNPIGLMLTPNLLKSEEGECFIANRDKPVPDRCEPR